MKLTFIGAAHEVTGSCSLLEINGKKILIDCGMEQGGDIYENAELPISAEDIDYVLLTHAHIDHSGKIPYLVKCGFKGKVFATRPTTELCKIMLLDSAHIQEFEAQWQNRKARRSGDASYEPFYTVNDATAALELFVPCEYDKDIPICDELVISFIDAGHLLGSSSIHIAATESGVTKTLLFSGDLGNIDRPLIKNPQQPEGADIVVIESTYGTRLHGERPDYISQFTRIIQDTLDKGGNLVIPSFAVGRTQEILYLIREIKEKQLIRHHDGFKVFIDSPLAVEATKIFSEDMEKYFDEETNALIGSGVNPLYFEGLSLAVTSDESKLINADAEPKIIISASGMCEAGRIRHHLKHNLWREESTILFVGYQAEGTLGRSIVNGAQIVKLFGEPVQINANILEISGISGHADRDMLLGWIKGFSHKPSVVYVNHGGDAVCDEFAAYITEQTGIFATAPYSGGEYDLLSGACLRKGNSVRLERAVSQGRLRANSVFERLVSAGRRLLRTIEQNREGANKDLAKFADQINSLCDKWER